MASFDIAIIGGDSRLAYMAPCLAEKGYRVVCYATESIVEDTEAENPCSYADSLKEAVESADIVVGGIPFFKNEKLFAIKELSDMEAGDFYRNMKQNQKLFGGIIPETFKKKCEERKIACYDFMRDEPLAIFNAIATAEGVILEALKNQLTNIHGSKSLVLGYGRCGRVLGDKLKGLSADVTICSRNEQELAYASSLGMHTISLHNLEDNIYRYEYVYNTIPAILIRKNMLKKMKRDVLIIDIASGEGGVDYKAAKALGVQALLCPGLPGKYAPKISAYGLVDYVIRKAF